MGGDLRRGQLRGQLARLLLAPARDGIRALEIGRALGVEYQDAEELKQRIEPGLVIDEDRFFG